MRATIAGLRLLLAGDVEEDGQRNAVASGADLSTDVLLVPHHGSGRQLPEFLAATRASIAVFSVGLDNDYGHPAAASLAPFAAYGAAVLRTDLAGDVVVSTEDGVLGVRTRRP